MYTVTEFVNTSYLCYIFTNVKSSLFDVVCTINTDYNPN